MGMAGRLATRWSEANRNYVASQQQASDVGSGLGSISKVLRMMLQSGVLAVGAYLVINQQATAGIIIAGSILSGRALAPVDLAIANWKGFIAARQGWQRLTRLLTLIPPQASPMPLQPPTRSLTVESASVAPPGQQKIVVHDLTIALESGNGLGVIGPTGSGKSSVARMLVGVWQTARGSVRLDGAALDQWSSEALGRHIGYLPQDVELFAGTVADNIARFEDKADPRPRPPACMISSSISPMGTRPRSASRAVRCRPARPSASRWRARSIAIRSWSCSTNRIPISIPKAMRH